MLGTISLAQISNLCYFTHVLHVNMTQMEMKEIRLIFVDFTDV